MQMIPIVGLAAQRIPDFFIGRPFVLTFQPARPLGQSSASTSRR
jgi:hypothetical protein